MANLYSQLPTPSSPTTEVIENPGFFVMDMRLTQTFLENFEAYIAFNNIFDRYYEPERGYPDQGRNIFGGVTAKF